MDNIIQQNRIRYQRQLLQGVLRDLDIAKQQFMKYRNQVSVGYDAQEMHYVMNAMNETLRHLYQMQLEANALLEQFRFVERSLG